MPLKLSKRGNVYWIRGTVRGVTSDGERKSFSIYKTAATSDRTVAETIRAKTESRILDEIAFGKAKVVTFREAAEDYVAGGGSQRFLLEVRADETETGLVPYFGETVMGSITQEDLDKAAKELHPGAQPETLNRQVYTPFIAVWNNTFGNDPKMARKWKRPRKPKGTNVIRIRSQRSGQAPVDYERAAKFVAAMSPAPAMVMTFLFYTGLRPIEAFALAAEDVSVEKRWAVVRRSKTGEPRGVPLHSFLCEWISPLVERGGLLFRGPRGEPYKEVQDGGGGLKSAIGGARRRSGIKDISPYTGRHTVSTQLVVNGIHPHIKDQILGHAADSMSRHYTNVPQAPLIEAIDTLPVPALWRDMPWLAAPLEWQSRLADGTGKRTDLEKGKRA